MTKLDYIDKPLTIQEPPLFTVISTFAGCGGSSTGYVWAGGKVRLAVEWDDNAVATYRANYPHTPIYHGDIAKLSVEECLSLSGIQAGELDIFDGSPPCQGFSTAGKRQLDDPRNQLFREYARLLKGIQPKVFVMENVSGMVKGKMKLVFAEILTELKSCGYKVSARLLNTMYFGVPQSRERMIFIGVRNDLGIEPSHPKAQTRPISVGSAIENAKHKTHAPVLSGKFGELSKKLKQGQTIQDLTGTFGHGNVKLRYDLPSPTIVKTAIFGSPKFIHPLESRGLSIGEVKRIGSFPDNYEFIGTYAEQWSRIGNSVPPRFMQAIAEHIYHNILTR